MRRKRLACRLFGHRWYDAQWIQYRPFTGGPLCRKGTQRCGRCKRVVRPFETTPTGPPWVHTFTG